MDRILPTSFGYSVKIPKENIFIHFLSVGKWSDLLEGMIFLRRQISYNLSVPNSTFTYCAALKKSWYLKFLFLRLINEEIFEWALFKITKFYQVINL